MGRYDLLFQDFERPLGPADGVAPQVIEASAGRLGVVVPEALCDFVRVAVNASDFTRAHDRFLDPGDWLLHDGKLVFAEENQAVVLYGVATMGSDADPPAFIVNNDEGALWREACPRCSEFIEVMLLWQAAFGGALAHTASAMLPVASEYALSSCWRRVGTVNTMSGYRKPGLAACVVDWDGGRRLFVGSTSAASLHSLGAELNLRFDDGC